MIDSLNFQTFLTLTAGGNGNDGATGGNIFADPFILIMLAVLVLLFVVTLRRGRKMREQQRQAHSGAVIGAEVVTAGGMVGTVVHRDETRQRLTLEFSNGNRADFLLGAVQQVVEPAPGQQNPGEQSSGDLNNG